MLLWVAVAIVGALAAKDYAAKRKGLMTRTEQALPEKDLLATSLSDEQGRAVKYVGTLRRVEGGYTVGLIREADGERTESCSEVMPSLEKVEVYLTSCTSFVCRTSRPEGTELLVLVALALALALALATTKLCLIDARPAADRRRVLRVAAIRVAKAIKRGIARRN